MSIYYQDELVTLHHGDSREVMASMADASVDAVITDPPYSENTHAMAKSNKGKGHGVKAIGFDCFTDDDLFRTLAECGRLSRRWVVANLDYKHAFKIDADPLPNLRVLRIGVWVKTNPMPQISADRPATGWEAIAYMHREGTKPAWNAGGKHGNYILPTAQNEGAANVYMQAFDRAVVEAFIAEYAVCGPAQLVTRVWTGETHTGWVAS